MSDKSDSLKKIDWRDAIQPDPDLDMSWQNSAKCRGADPDLFFPGQSGSDKKAKEICENCPVENECLKYAFRTNQRFGIWGKLTWEERRKLLRKQALKT